MVFAVTDHQKLSDRNQSYAEVREIKVELLLRSGSGLSRYDGELTLTGQERTIENVLDSSRSMYGDGMTYQMVPLSCECADGYFGRHG